MKQQLHSRLFFEGSIVASCSKPEDGYQMEHQADVIHAEFQTEKLVWYMYMLYTA
jgi:hypothetical protein